MECLFVTIFMATILVVHGAPPPPVSPFPSPPPSPGSSCGRDIKNVFVLAGQSNMVGRGGVVNYVWDKNVPEECKPTPQIMRFNANLTWEEAQEPLHQGIENPEKACGVGPGMPFASHLLKLHSALAPIGLVPCAVGDTSISDWSKGTHLYTAMITRTQTALFLSGATLRGVLFFQGEKDTTLESAPLYKGRLQRFIGDVRADLQLPFLPFIEVALDMDAGVYTDLVRDAQFETAAEVPHVECVDARGLPRLKGDAVHLNTSSQVVLGGRMADLFLKMR